MRCAWCERTSHECLPLMLTVQSEIFARFLPELSQQETWCAPCRSKVAILVERVRDMARQEIGFPTLCCVCGKLIRGAVSHGYCEACSAREEAIISAKE